MRGFFGVGVENISKAMNLGNLIRSAHAFGASFFFTIGDRYTLAGSDTSKAAAEIPLYHFDTPEELQLPEGCALVAVELLEEAVDLPSFRHPRAAAYVLGPERGSLSPELIERAELSVKIPTRFCINVATAGAVLMYDRVLSLGRFPARPLVPGGEVVPLPEHRHGDPKRRT